MARPASSSARSSPAPSRTTTTRHGEVTLTRALAAVEAGGRWWYADPNGPHAFGGRAPVLREKLLRVPAGAEPPPDELSEYKKQVQEQQEQIRELQAKYAELRGALERATQTTPAPAASPNVYKYVAVGALGLLAVTLVLLYRETRRDQPRPRVRTSARRKRRTRRSGRRRGG